LTKENSIKRPPFLHGPAELQADVQRGSYIEFPHKNILYLKDVSDTGPRSHTKTGTQLREASNNFNCGVSYKKLIRKHDKI
jgi:hypothetical protein